jgi:hypothetical protein
LIVAANLIVNGGRFASERAEPLQGERDGVGARAQILDAQAGPSVTACELDECGAGGFHDYTGKDGAGRILHRAVMTAWRAAAGTTTNGARSNATFVLACILHLTVRLVVGRFSVWRSPIVASSSCPFGSVIWWPTSCGV